MDIDLSEKLAPVIRAMREYREQMGLTGREVSTLAGYTATWCTELESGTGLKNPTVSRLVRLAGALEVQEFGVYVVIDGHHTAAPLVGGDEDDDELVELKPWGTGDDEADLAGQEA